MRGLEMILPVANTIGMAVVDSMHDLDEGVSCFGFGEVAFLDDSVK